MAKPSHQSSKNVFESVVFGQGLASVLLAHAESIKGRKTLLITSGTSPLGSLDPISGNGFELFRDFGFWPNRPELLSTLEWMEATSGISLLAKDQPARPPITFGKGQLQAFVGFGERAPAGVEEIRPFVESENLDLKMPLSELGHHLMRTPLFELRTDFDAKEFVLEAGAIVGLRSQNGEEIFANRWFLAEPMRRLFGLLPADHISAREQTRLHRTKSWIRVSLDTIYPEVVSSERAMHVLMGTTDDAVPCLGGFESPSPTGTQSAHWFALVDPDSEDEDATAHALREMKRQIKRAYPATSVKPKFERISVEVDFGGIWACPVDASGRWPGLSNAWILETAEAANLSLFGILRQAAFVSLAANQISPDSSPTQDSREEAAPAAP